MDNIKGLWFQANSEEQNTAQLIGRQVKAYEDGAGCAGSPVRGVVTGIVLEDGDGDSKRMFQVRKSDGKTFLAHEARVL